MRITGSAAPARHRPAAAPCSATRRETHLLREGTNVPNLASQSRVAFASMVWNTGSSSPGELEITCSTSEVAVCCSSASEIVVRWRSSLNRRVFSMAMTAWLAKFLTSAICLSVNGRTSWR